VSGINLAQDEPFGSLEQAGRNDGDDEAIPEVLHP
jgi:hypothetical protein